MPATIESQETPFPPQFFEFHRTKKGCHIGSPSKNNLLPSWLWGKETKMLLYHQFASIYHIASDYTHEDALCFTAERTPKMIS
mgnify:CR=1